jgi:predicted dehydrogenase
VSLRFALLGTGFWSRFQLAGWRELGGPEGADVECSEGTVELAPDYWVRVTTRDGTMSSRHPPVHYPWATPEFAVVHASIVPCLGDLLGALRTGQPAATSGEDNLETMRLVFAAYEPAETGRAIRL